MSVIKYTSGYRYLKNKVAEILNLDKNVVTIVAPAAFRPNSDYVLTLTLHDSDVILTKACIMKVSVQDADDENHYNVERKIKLMVNATQMLTIPIEDIPMDRNYKIVAKSLSGIEFHKEAKIEILKRNILIMIQTDRAIYKPGDCVKFRILVLDCKQQPVHIEGNGLNITFIDPVKNRVKQWKGASTSPHGVFQSEFQLSDLPKFGYWKILAEVGEQRKSKGIEIKEYVLPKFEVNIESAEHFSLKDKKVTIYVNAKYTYGKKVRGKATVSVSKNIYPGHRNIRQEYHMETNNSHTEEDFETEEESSTKENSDTEDDDLKPVAKKTIDINGRGMVEFDIKNELKFDIENKYSTEFKISTSVVENLTGKSHFSNHVAYFMVHKTSYKIFDTLPWNYQSNKPVNFTIFVRNYDDSLPTLISATSKKITIIRERILSNNKSEITETDCQLSSTGELSLAWDTRINESRFSIEVIYDGQRQKLKNCYAKSSHMQPSSEEIQVEILTESPSVNSDVEIEVLSAQPLKNCTYQLVAGEKIIKSETFNLHDNTSRSHRFKFTATYDLIPKAHVLVYCVRNGNLFAAHCHVNVKRELKNFIEIDMNPNTANPGQIVSIDIKTNPKSFVGLLGIDQSVMLLKTGNDLSSNTFFEELGALSNIRYPWMCNWEHFSECGVVLLTNIVSPYTIYPSFRGGGGPQRIVSSKIRKNFPETWLWECLTVESSDGIMSLKRKVPDTITSWIVTGFSVDSVTGLGITKEAKKLTVFQPFFISLNLPYSVKRGEVITVPCTVFNYMDNDVNAILTLENEHNEFEFIDDQKAAHDPFKTTNMLIKSNDGITVHFVIKPTCVGMISLKLKAVSAMAGDTVIKLLNVQPEGVPQFFNKAIFVDLSKRSKMKPTSLQIDIPNTALPDSTSIEVSCVGDLLGGTIKNLQNLISLPNGCGEQIMLGFVPNIVVLNYLTHTGQLTAEIETRVKKYMEIGYQRELNFRHKDGSFSAFGTYDVNGSTWLTAFVAKSFQRASEHIYVNKIIIKKALDYLSSVQNQDGSFTEKGTMFHKEMQGGSSKGVALTAYVLMAFLQDKETGKAYEKTIHAAIVNIIDSLKEVNDVYALGVAAYALQLAQFGSEDEILLKFLNKAQNEGNYKWWKKSMQTNAYYPKLSKTLDVEVTAYGLLALLAAQKDSECLPILKWLLNQRNNQGGFEGTQDTIVGIEALAAFAAKFATKNSEIKITAMSTEDNVKKNFVVNKENSLILQSERLSADTRTVQVNASGHGFALLQVSYRYNINETDPLPAFKLKIKPVLRTSEHIELQISTCYQPPESNKEKQSNMAILEISFPSGFIVDTDALNDLKSKIELIKKVETKDGDTVAIIYFDYLTRNLITLNLDGFRQFVVLDQKPSSIVVYDYYDSALSAREFYSLELKEQSNKKPR